MTFKPKFISFDCYGTLINFEMGPTAKNLFEERVPAGRMPAFLDSFRAYRLDEVLGEWKPFFDVVENSIQRACKAHGVEYRPIGRRRTVRRHPDLAAASERRRGPGGDRSARPAGDPVELDGRPDPRQRRPPQGAVSRRLHRRGSARVQAAAADLRIYVRPARLRAGADDARLVELPLRPDDGVRPGLHGEGVHRSRSRAGAARAMASAG